jgi:hypothetical protein
MENMVGTWRIGMPKTSQRQMIEVFRISCDKVDEEGNYTCLRRNARKVLEDFRVARSGGFTYNGPPFLPCVTGNKSGTR